MAEQLDLEELRLDLISAYQFGSLTRDLVDDVTAALERAEKDREYLREKNDIIRAYAGPTGMTPEDVAAALGRIPELERQVANLEADLHSRDADYWRERADRVEAALRTHWLANVECDHELELDKPWCACSRVDLGWHPNVGAAVEAWIRHVLTEAPALAAAPAENASQ